MPLLLPHTCPPPACRHEIVGIVTEVGAEVKKFKPGDRAAVGTYVSSCHNCEMCKEGEDIFCPKVGGATTLSRLLCITVHRLDCPAGCQLLAIGYRPYYMYGRPWVPGARV